MVIITTIIIIIIIIIVVVVISIVVIILVTIILIIIIIDYTNLMTRVIMKRNQLRLYQETMTRLSRKPRRRAASRRRPWNASDASVLLCAHTRAHVHNLYTDIS